MEWFHEVSTPNGSPVMDALTESKACWSVKLLEYACTLLSIHILEVAKNIKMHRMVNWRKLKLIIHSWGKKAIQGIKAVCESVFMILILI